MFKVSPAWTNTAEKLFKQHRVFVSGSDIFYHNIRLLTGRHRILDRKTFNEFYRSFTDDIELETSPIEAIIPCDNAPKETPDEMDPADLVNERLFLINREIPEYKRIMNRVTLDELHSTLNPTHPVIMALDEQKFTYEDVIDDIYLYWSVYKYLAEIEKIRIQTFSNMAPIVEYIVGDSSKGIPGNISKEDIQKFLRKNEINEEKVNKHWESMFFSMEYEKIVCPFYKDADGKNHEEYGSPVFDLDNLICRLMSNIDCKGDKYIILGMYIIASFAVSEFKCPNAEKSDCFRYVCDVLSVV